MQVEIQVENPLDEPIEFDVIHDGDGLLGDPLLLLAPKEVRVYQLIYSPLQAGSAKAAVSFINDKVGEFWYDLDLHAKPDSPKIIDNLKCELGRHKAFNLPIENPTGEEILVQISTDNPRNFFTDNDTMTIPPYEALQIPMWFNPSSMREVQSAQIAVAATGIDDWTFHCSGCGVPPTVMDPITVSAAVGLPTTAVLDFRNPFLESLQISVSLSTTERPKTFEVISKKSPTTVGPSLSLQIPYSFNPHQMMNCKAVIEVRAAAEGHSLLWKFPVHGVAEAPRSGNAFKFACKARQRFEKTLELVPHGLGEVLETEYFTHEVVYSSDHEKLLKRSLQIVPLQTEIQPGDEKTGQPVRFRLIFEPLRPVEASIELLLMKSSGGRWRYSVALEAGEPEVDDVIEIEAPLGRAASVSFRLYNQLDGLAPFQAYFTPDSPPEFTINPSTGVLGSQADGETGSDGTPFLITYTPREYGKQLVGRLVIITTEMQWTYEVRGQHPKYVAPQVTEARVDSYLPQEMASQLGSRTAARNYVQENMRTVGQRYLGNR